MSEAPRKTPQYVTEGAACRDDVLKTAGSSRAIASGMYSFIFSFASTLFLWLFLVLASGSEGLAYKGENEAIMGIVGIANAGFSQAFIAQVKEKHVKDPQAGLMVASAYTKVMFTYGVIAASVCLVLAFVDSHPIFQYALLFGVPQVLLGYCLMSPMSWSLNVANRYDITSFIGAVGGIGSLAFGLLFIFNKAPAPLFASLGLINSLITLPILCLFFWRKSPFKLKDLYFAASIRRDKGQVREVLKYGGLTTLSNMESFQLVSNVNFYLASVSFLFILPEAEALKGISLLTILNIYSQIKCSLNLFSSPLNVELAEAYCRGDREKMADIVSHTVKFSYLIGLGLIIGYCGLAGIILRFLHRDFFLLPGGGFNDALFQVSLLVAIILSIGQGGFGVANLFANALIGTEKAVDSAKVYVLALVLSMTITPLCIIVFQLGMLGIAWSTLGVGILTAILMQRTLQNRLNLQIKSRLVNLLPPFTILFLLIFFFPYGAVTGIYFLDMAIAIGLVIVAYVVPLAFFGVFQDDQDWQVIHDMYVAIGLRRIAPLLVRQAKFMYRLNPFHRKKQIPTSPIPRE